MFANEFFEGSQDLWNFFNKFEINNFT